MIQRLALLDLGTVVSSLLALLDLGPSLFYLTHHFIFRYHHAGGSVHFCRVVLNHFFRAASATDEAAAELLSAGSAPDAFWRQYFAQKPGSSDSIIFVGSFSLAVTRGSTESCYSSYKVETCNKDHFVSLTKTTL